MQTVDVNMGNLVRVETVTVNGVEKSKKCWQRSPGNAIGTCNYSLNDYGQDGVYVLGWGYELNHPIDYPQYYYFYYYYYCRGDMSHIGNWHMLVVRNDDGADKIIQRNSIAILWEGNRQARLINRQIYSSTDNSTKQVC